MADCVKALKEWTGKTSATIVFDSTVDEFTDNGLFTKVKGKPNIALVATTTDGDVFGGFYSVAVTKQGGYFHDPNMFAFSFESHGRCETPQSFFGKMRDRAHVRLFKNDPFGQFVVFWCGDGGWFSFGNEKSCMFCYDLSRDFEGIEDTTLTGNNRPENFTCCRLVVVHLE